MKTKEAIEKLSNPIHFDKDFGFVNDEVLIELDTLEAGDIIALLQRGEKYEKMFNTILNWTMHDGSFIPVKELINLEQKYFPKEANNGVHGRDN